MKSFDAGSCWVKCPPSRMRDQDFDLSYMQERMDSNKPVLVESNHEKARFIEYSNSMMWDGAQCMRLNNDILFNCSNENHRAGLKWLQRVLGKDYNVHEMNVCDNHIDSTIVPLKEGLFLLDASRAEKVLAQLPDKFKSWDYIIAPESKTQNLYSKKDLRLASKSIDINVLSLSPEHLICHDEYHSLLQPLLKPHDIECIPQRLRHSELFSGAFHCLTLDLNRG